MLCSAWQPLSKLPRFPALAECLSDVEPDTRQMVRAQNKKKKKSGGFQSMGKTLTLAGINGDQSPSNYFLYSSVSTVFSMILGLSFPVYKGVMKKGYKVPTPIQRKVELPLLWKFSLIRS